MPRRSSLTTQVPQEKLSRDSSEHSLLRSDSSCTARAIGAAFSDHFGQDPDEDMFAALKLSFGTTTSTTKVCFQKRSRLLFGRTYHWAPYTWGPCNPDGHFIPALEVTPGRTRCDPGRGSLKPEAVHRPRSVIMPTNPSSRCETGATLLHTPEACWPAQSPWRR